MVGPRICIAGNSGSGKSTLAKALGAKLGVPVYHLDRELLRGNFENLPRDQYQAAHQKLIIGETWIIDGNYRRSLDARIERATLVVFLDVSRFITLPRVLRRVGQDRVADTIPDGARYDRLSWKFIKWVLGYNRRKRIEDLRQRCSQAGVPLLILKNQSIDRMVVSIEQKINRKSPPALIERY